MLTRIEALIHQGHGAAIAQFRRQGNVYIPDILVHTWKSWNILSISNATLIFMKSKIVRKYTMNISPMVSIYVAPC